MEFNQRILKKWVSLVNMAASEHLQRWLDQTRHSHPRCEDLLSLLFITNKQTKMDGKVLKYVHRLPKRGLFFPFAASVAWSAVATWNSRVCERPRNAGVVDFWGQGHTLV